MGKRLLEEQHLTYATAEISTIMEMAVREATDMATSSRESELNFMDKEKKITCYCCGKKDHISKNCRFKSYTCNAYRKKVI